MPLQQCVILEGTLSPEILSSHYMSSEGDLEQGEVLANEKGEVEVEVDVLVVLPSEKEGVDIVQAMVNISCLQGVEKHGRRLGEVQCLEKMQIIIRDGETTVLNSGNSNGGRLLNQYLYAPYPQIRKWGLQLQNGY